jgi:hypothetical protein
LCSFHSRYDYLSAAVHQIYSFADGYTIMRGRKTPLL